MALRDDVLKFYPQYAWALDIPDVANVLQDAVANQWDAGRFTQALQGTNWWKTTAPAQREYQQRQATDPEALGQQIRQENAKVWDLSQSLGVNLNAAQADQLGRQYIQLGWNDDQLRDSLIGVARQQGAQGPGNLGQISSNILALQTQASQYLVPIDNNTVFNWATQIAAGEKKPEDYNAIFQDWAKSKFSYDPNLVERMNEGFTPEQLFAPQKTAIAKLMEVAPETVNLQDPKWNKVLQYNDPATGKMRAATQAEAEQVARGTAEWRSTDNGQQAGSQLLGSIREMMTGSR